MKSLKSNEKLSLFIYKYASLALFIGVFIVFSLLSKKFLELQNLINIVNQTASIGIIAVGATFVLLVAGVDLSVGAVMFLSAGIAGKLFISGLPLWLVIIVMLAVGLCVGLFNGYISTKLKIMAFIVTLSTLYVGRGLSLLITETKELRLPESFLKIGYTHFLGIPVPIVIFIVILAIGHLILTKTPYGRQIYAVGNDPSAAKKSGINVDRILISVYIISGLLAAIGGIVSVAQLGTVAPNFGSGREFDVIAAVVLGGTSLFGGRGNVFPGTVIGAILMLTIRNGLTIINADPYVYPLVTGFVIFLAVFVDSMRNEKLAILGKRKIRVQKD
jgi:ribose transport system permease protein